MNDHTRIARLLPLCALLTALALSTSACPPKPVPEPPVPPDAGEPASCADACDHLRELGCEGAEDTAEGASCEDVCQNVQDSGIIAWDLDCRAAAPSCEAAYACEE